MFIANVRVVDHLLCRQLKVPVRKSGQMLEALLRCVADYDSVLRCVGLSRMMFEVVNEPDFHLRHYYVDAAAAPIRLYMSPEIRTLLILVIF